MNHSLIEIETILDVEKYIDGLKVVIFDLDDTLYSEKEYVRSGYHNISSLFPEIANVESRLWKLFLDKVAVIDVFLKQEEVFTGENKEKCMRAYRFQEPDIHLYPGVWDMLKRLKEHYYLGLITDGRPEGQRSKIKALGLSEIFDCMIITDELGGSKYRKPNARAYQIVAERFGTDFRDMCYVGDNIKKDFVAPIKLGMRSIWFRNVDGLYI